MRYLMIEIIQKNRQIIYLQKIEYYQFEVDRNDSSLSRIDFVRKWKIDRDKPFDVWQEQVFEPGLPTHI